MRCSRTPVAAQSRAMLPAFGGISGSKSATFSIVDCVMHRLRSLPILDAGARLEGVIAREDVIRALEYCAQCEAEGA